MSADLFTRAVCDVLEAAQAHRARQVADHRAALAKINADAARRAQAKRAKGGTCAGSPNTPQALQSPEKGLCTDSQFSGDE